MRRTVLATLAGSLLALSLGGTARAQAPQKDGGSVSKSDEASQRFKSGVAFYKDKDFAAAMVEFKKAYELVPNYNVLFNLGQTARELKDYAAALTWFEQYLRDGGTKVAPARRKDVQGWIEELKRKVGKLKIQTNVDGAEVLVDDVAVGNTPLADPVVVNVGRRKLTARLSGYTPAQRAVDVAGTEESTVTLELVKIEPKPPPPEPPKEVPPEKPEMRIAAWATLSVTGAGVIAAAVTGGLAVSARSGLKAALATFPGDPKAIADAQSRTRTLAITTDVVGGITLAAAAVTTVLFVLAPKQGEKAKPAAVVEVSPTGVGIRGVF